MDVRGQSETIGLVLLLAISVIGVAVVVAAAGTALDSAEHAASVERAEQSLSVFDARAAMVALGRSDGQSVSLSGASGGSYEVRPDAGRMTLVREDENGTQIGDPIVNATLGSVVYENGDATVAYQGGGVWQSPGEGQGSTLVSPPEFNYQGATLTLPLIRVTGGESSAAGAPRARVSQADVRNAKFPTENRSNPLSGGTVVVRVHSEYYRGWAQYFRQRTAGNVSVYPDEKRVDLELIARGSGGLYSLDETPIELRGLSDGQPIRELSFTMYPNKASSFNDLHWALVADDGGSDRFEVEIDGGNPCKGKQPLVSVTYDNGSAVHEWENTSAWATSGSSFTYACGGKNGKEPTLFFDLTGETNVTYQGGTSPLANDSVGYVVNNYLAEMGPNVELEVTSKGKNRPPGNSASTDLDASTVDVQYNSSGARVVTFLHVTENAVNVSVT
ncbi:DUF7289 family protein [Halobacterium litoreum]|uniref:DUF7308 domain-containing protein n=1 Tax=Halobacterium litoreum TaxID=2039234 RepID=A0ABD5NIA4_9EURY|nr:hypothetical protein [Halobacterium litoreum]UHH12139.1 hypothetical protein LT972_08220 [Halobacterium litoreum]